MRKCEGGWFGQSFLPVPFTQAWVRCSITVWEIGCKCSYSSKPSTDRAFIGQSGKGGRVDATPTVSLKILKPWQWNVVVMLCVQMCFLWGPQHESMTPFDVGWTSRFPSGGHLGSAIFNKTSGNYQNCPKVIKTNKMIPNDLHSFFL